MINILFIHNSNHHCSRDHEKSWILQVSQGTPLLVLYGVCACACVCVKVRQTARCAGQRQSHKASYNYHQSGIIVHGIPIHARKETQPQTTFNCIHSTHKTGQRTRVKRTTVQRIHPYTVYVCTRTCILRTVVKGYLGVYVKQFCKVRWQSKRDGGKRGQWSITSVSGEWSQVPLYYLDHSQWRFNHAAKRK